MTREQKIIGAFVELADTLVADFDVVEFLHGLTEHCIALLDCAESGVLVADARGALRVLASSSERTDALDVLQSQNEEGPCFECYQRGLVVSSEDLAADAERWPRFAPMAVEKGFGSIQAIPLRVRSETIGALNLFRSEAGRMDDSDVLLGQGLADIAAVALLQERAVREARGVVEQLQSALTSRVAIEQAKGVLAARAGIGVDAAFARLRAFARDHNRRLSDVARGLIDGQLDETNLTEPASPTASESTELRRT